jgi:hypothetical protein
LRLSRLSAHRGICLAFFARDPGSALLLLGRISGLGRLPGDIVIQRDGFSCFFTHRRIDRPQHRNEDCA